MGIGLRLAWVFCLAWSSTACGMFPVWNVAHQTIGSLAHSPVRRSDAGPVVIDSSERSGVSGSLTAFSSVLTVMPTGGLFSSPTLRLSQNGDGSIAVLSDDRSASLLRGLDPALVNPAMLPFLFPSCDVSDPFPVVSH